MVLLDTNILVYAANSSISFNNKASEICGKAMKGEIKACVSIQNLYEFYRVITDPKRVPNPLSETESSKVVMEYINCEKIKKIILKDRTLNLMLKMAVDYKVRGSRIFDLLLVATMLDNGVNEILTHNDSDFKSFSEIRVKNPFKSKKS